MSGCASPVSASWTNTLISTGPARRGVGAVKTVTCNSPSLREARMVRPSAQEREEQKLSSKRVEPTQRIGWGLGSSRAGASLTKLTRHLQGAAHFHGLEDDPHSGGEQENKQKGPGRKGPQGSRHFRVKRARDAIRRIERQK